MLCDRWVSHLSRLFCVAGRHPCLSSRCRGFLFYPRIAVAPRDDSCIVAEFSKERCVPPHAYATSPIRVAREGLKDVTCAIVDVDDSFIACAPITVEVRGAMSYG